MFVRRESFKQYIRFYPVTTALIAVNVVMLLIMEFYGSSVETLTLLRFGAMFDLPGFQPEWWRYFTAMWLHIGWAHLLFNCFGLLVFAPPLEIMLGHLRYAVFYVVCGVCGNLASAIFHQDYFVAAGASGAIYGIYAAYLYLALFRKDIMDESSRKTIQTIIIMGFVYSIIVPNVDLWAHLGGFAGGLASTALIVLSVKRRNRDRD